MGTMESMELTKSYITEALFALMDKMPYDEISVSDIAKKAGVGRATFYRHYKTKEDVIREYFVQETAAFLKAVPQAPTDYDDFYEMIFTAFPLLRQEKTAFRRLLDAHMEAFYYEYMNRMLVLNFEQNHYSDFFYAPYHIAGSLCNVSLAWVKRDCMESVKQMTDAYCRDLFAGLSQGNTHQRKGENL